MSLPNWVAKHNRSEFSARLHAAKALRRSELGADADTLRKRALDDARGMVLHEGTTYECGTEKHWRVVRSVLGRTNQLDVFVNDVLWRTCGPRHLPAWLR